jgi:hypothetical protein
MASRRAAEAGPAALGLRVPSSHGTWRCAHRTHLRDDQQYDTDQDVDDTAILNLVLCDVLVLIDSFAVDLEVEIGEEEKWARFGQVLPDLDERVLRCHVERDREFSVELEHQFDGWLELSFHRPQIKINVDIRL